MLVLWPDGKCSFCLCQFCTAGGGVQNQRRCSSQEVVPDFVSLNWDAMRSSVVTSKKLSQYQGQMEVLMNKSHNPKAKTVRTP